MNESTTRTSIVARHNAAHLRVGWMSAYVWIPTVRIGSREPYGVKNKEAGCSERSVSLYEGFKPSPRFGSFAQENPVSRRRRPPGENVLEGMQG